MTLARIELALFVFAVLTAAVAIALHRGLLARVRSLWPPVADRARASAPDGPYRAAHVLTYRPGDAPALVRLTTLVAYAFSIATPLWIVLALVFGALLPATELHRSGAAAASIGLVVMLAVIAAAVLMWAAPVWLAGRWQGRTRALCAAAALTTFGIIAIVTHEGAFHLPAAELDWAHDFAVGLMTYPCAALLLAILLLFTINALPADGE